MANRALKIALVVGLLLAIPVFAQVAGFKVQWIDYAIQASNPVTLGRRGSYVKTSDDALHYVNSVGADIALGAGGSSTLQASYTAGAASSPNPIALDATRKNIELTPFGGQTTDPLMSFKRDGLAATPQPAQRLYNSTASTVGVPAQISPTVQFDGALFTAANHTSSWRMYNNTALFQAGDTAQFSLDHSLDGAAFDNVLNIVQQTSLGETILSSTGVAANAIYIYPGNQGAGKAFIGAESNLVKFGPSLTSTFRMRLSVSGLNPEMDGIVPLGDDTHRYLSANSLLWEGSATGAGTAAAPATVVRFKTGTADTASLNNQLYSGSVMLQGDGWDTNTNSRRNASFFIQAQPQQEVASAPSVEIKFFSQVVSITSPRERAKIRSGREDDNNGGEFVVAHMCGMSATPGIIFGAAANCTTAASVTSIDGTDMAGEVTFTTGAAACAGGLLFQLTFATPYRGGTPYVQLTSANANAAFSGQSIYYDRGASSITTASVLVQAGLLAGTDYKWTYSVQGK